MWPPGRGQIWPKGHNLNNFGRGPLDDAIHCIPNMKALGLIVSDKIFENCILKTYFLTLWPTYATNWNNLNNFGRGPPRDHSCEVYASRTPHDDGQRPVTIAYPEHFVNEKPEITRLVTNVCDNPRSHTRSYIHLTFANFIYFIFKGKKIFLCHHSYFDLYKF